MTTSDYNISDNEHITTTNLQTTIHDGDPEMTSVKSHDDIDMTTEPVTTQIQISNMELTTSDDSISDNKHITSTSFLTTIHDGDPEMTSVESHDDIDMTTIDRFLSSPVITTEMIKGMVLIFCTTSQFPFENSYLSGVPCQMNSRCLAWHLTGI